VSPELETLDQLLGGDLPLPVVRTFFGDGDRFVRAFTAMLEGGELRLVEADGTDVSKWRWREVLNATDPSTRVAITKAGTKRIA
jgi:hypothetical protein